MKNTSRSARRQAVKQAKKMKKLSEKKRRKLAKKEAALRIKKMLEERKADLISCVHINSKNEPFGLNMDKLSSTYLEYFPTAYQEDSGFYFQYSSIRGLWVKKSLLQITKHLKKIKPFRKLQCYFL